MAASLVVLVALTLFGAYGWQPAAVEGYRSPYESSYLDTSLARFHYSKTGSGSPVVLVAGGAQWLYSYRDTIAALHAVGTEVLVVPTRRLALPPGLGPVHQLARMVIQREAHAVTFTTVAAVTALLDVTRRTGRRSLLLRALAKDVVVATADARSAAPFLELDIPAFWPTGGDTTDELGRLLFDALVARRRDFRADGRWIAVQGDALLVDSGAILLPPRPAAVLRTLADYPERVLSRSAIEQLVPLARHGGPLAVEQAVRRLRAALGSYDWLVATVPGRGYRLAVDPDVVKPG